MYSGLSKASMSGEVFLKQQRAKQRDVGQALDTLLTFLLRKQPHLVLLGEDQREGKEGH